MANPLTSRDPWQTLFATRTTVETSKVAQAAEIISKFSGSWAGNWALDFGGITETGTLSSATPGAIRTKLSHLGQPGFPEINFPPYAFGTNRTGPRGGALLGHPISFSVVGPTIKNPQTDWGWTVTTGSPDKITLVDAGGRNILQLYGFTALSDFPGGLYLVFSVPAGPSDLNQAGPPKGGIGDGDAKVGQKGMVGLEVGSKYEIFRVTALADANTSFVLDTSKSILDHFTVGTGVASPPNFARAITLFTPAATRLVALRSPGELPGEEKTFVVVPPERALNQDDQYPYSDWIDGGGFYENEFQNEGISLLDTGEAFHYKNKPLLPIPRPIRGFSASVQAGSPTIQAAGYMTLQFPTETGTDLIGKIVHFWQIETRNGTELTIGADTGYQADVNSLLGWFEIIGVSTVGNSVTVRRMEEVDPSTGRPFLGGNGWFCTDPVVTDQDITLLGTLHNPVSDLWKSQVATATITINTNASIDTAHPDTVTLLGTTFTAVAGVPALGEFKKEANATLTATSLAAAINLFTPYVRVSATSSGPVVTVYGQVHTITLSLTTGGCITAVEGQLDYQALNLDDLNSARLTNLIDPTWVSQSYKDQANSFGGNSNRPDRAIFNTATSGAGAAGTNADPGNLLDLGFRMVLFPATTATVTLPTGDTATRIVPDFSRPMNSTEGLLDATKPNEKQYVTMDYSNGIVRLSHAVKNSTTNLGALYPDTDIFALEDNRQHSMVLFASCVPYSQEAGQLGASLRVTATDTSSAGTTDANCVPGGGSAGSGPQSDIWSGRIVMPLEPQTIASNVFRNPESIVLSGDWRMKIPSTGFIEILTGTGADGSPIIESAIAGAWRGSLYGYYGMTWDGTNTTLTNTYGGGETGVDTFVVSATNPAVAVLRREVWGPSAPDGVASVEYQHDVTYGAAKRSSSLRFEGAALQPNPDGSLTVKVVETVGRSNQTFIDKVFSSWILDGGELSYTTGPAIPAGKSYIIYVAYSAATIVMRGVTMTVPASTVAVKVPAHLAPNATYTIAGAPTQYVYLEHTDGTTCPVAIVTDALPLPHPEDILLGSVNTMYAVAGITLTSYAALVATDYFEINGVPLTCVVGAPGVDEFQKITDTATTVGNIATAIRAPANSFDGFITSASASSPDISIQGAFLTLTENSPGLTVTAIDWYASTTDLRYLLNDLDRRVDIYCGQWGPESSDHYEIQVVSAGDVAGGDQIDINGDVLTANGIPPILVDEFQTSGSAATLSDRIAQAINESSFSDKYDAVADGVDKVTITSRIGDALTITFPVLTIPGSMTATPAISAATNWLPANFKPHFPTLAKAVDYANEITQPSRGKSARKARILVIGRTTEDTPTVVRTDGLIVESMPREKPDDTTLLPSDPEINFDIGSTKYGGRVLIDIHGQNNLIFRNLTFRASRTYAPTKLFFGDWIFSNSQVGVVHRLVIDNCRVNGVVDGLCIFPIGQYRNIQITNNTVWAAVTSGLYLGNLDSDVSSDDGVIENNYIVRSGAITGATGIWWHDTTQRIYLTDQITLNDTVEINDSVFTAKNAENTAAREFDRSGSVAAAATSLAACINAAAGAWAGTAVVYNTNEVWVTSRDGLGGQVTITVAVTNAILKVNDGGTIAARDQNNQIRHNKVSGFTNAITTTGQDIVDSNYSDSAGIFSIRGWSGTVRGNRPGYLAISGWRNMIVNNNPLFAMVVGCLSSTGPSEGGRESVVSGNNLGVSGNALEIRATALRTSVQGNVVTSGANFLFEVREVHTLNITNNGFVNGNTITINGLVMTARVAATLPSEFTIGGTAAATATNITATLNGLDAFQTETFRLICSATSSGAVITVADITTAATTLTITTALGGGTAVVAISADDVYQGAHPVSVMGNMTDIIVAKDHNSTVRATAVHAPQTGGVGPWWFKAVMGNSASTIWGDSSTGATAEGAGYNVLS